MTFTSIGKGASKVLARIRVTETADLPRRINSHSNKFWDVYQHPDGHYELRYPVSFTHSIVREGKDGTVHVRVFTDKDGDVCTDPVWYSKHHAKALHVLGRSHDKTVR